MQTQFTLLLIYSLRLEHGPDSQVALVLVGEGIDVNAITEELSKQCNALPHEDFATKALSHSFMVFAHDMIEAISFSNVCAPEHLIVNVKDAERWEGFIENAGLVLLGQWTPESLGIMPVEPTMSFRLMVMQERTGISLDSFLIYITVQSLTEEGLSSLGPYLAKMAKVGLEAHQRAVTLRLQDIQAKQAAV